MNKLVHNQPELSPDEKTKALERIVQLGKRVMDGDEEAVRFFVEHATEIDAILQPKVNSPEAEKSRATLMVERVLETRNFVKNFQLRSIAGEKTIQLTEDDLTFMATHDIHVKNINDPMTALSPTEGRAVNLTGPEGQIICLTIWPQDGNFEFRQMTK
jgi:hypothetical protein